MAKKVRPITQLPDDIKEKVETALAESASKIFDTYENMKGNIISRISAEKQIIFALKFRRGR